MIGGISLEDKKEASITEWSIRKPLPAQKVYIPLQEAAGASLKCTVHLNQRVAVGDKIADASDPQSVPLYSGVDGQVTDFVEVDLPQGRRSRAVEIKTSGYDAPPKHWERSQQDWKQLSRSKLLAVFRERGLVELNASMMPLHTKIKQASKRTSLLIVNACESEPYLTAEYALMMSYPNEILKGAEVLRQAVDAERVLIVTENNKLEAAELLQSKRFLRKLDHFDVKIVKSRYPQGSPVSLLRDFAGYDLRDWAEGFGAPAIIFDVATIFAVYEAVFLDKPLFERVVTIGGECIAESHNVWFPFGTYVKDAMKVCRGLLRAPRKIVLGGPMRGMSIPHENVPIQAGTQGVLALPKEVATEEKTRACIRCGLCVEVCPVAISPVMITLAAERDEMDLAREYGAEHCIECGNCTYICPSKRPMLDLIRQTLPKEQLQKSG